MSTDRKAIIIGAGVAGLATAIRLAVQQLDVVVYEKNSYPGGKLSHVTLGDFHFDAGPSLFLQPENIIELFQLAGEPIEAYLQFEKLPTTCTYFYENGTVVNAYASPPAFAAEMKLKTGEPEEKVLSYLKQSENIYDDIGQLFLNHSLQKRSTLLKAPLLKAVKAAGFSYIFTSLNKVNSKYFTQPETIQLFNRFATYNGSNPYKAPAMLSMIPHLELNQGAYYPKGGMKSITNALYRLALKLGVQFIFDSRVQRIINLEGRVKGVVVNDENVYAAVVVSNTDVYFTYKHLLNDVSKSKKLAKHESSSSAIIFYWGMNKTFPELQLHNIFFSKDYQQEFGQLFNDKTIPGDPTIYVNITSKMESGHAPAGSENWFVMVNAPANENQDWEVLKARCRKAVIEKLSRMLKTDIESCITVQETLDPVKMEEATASYKGAIYGSSSNAKMAAFLRHPNFSAAAKGLYFAGGTVHPGGGIPLCLKSAKLVSELINTDSNSLFHHH